MNEQFEEPVLSSPHAAGIRTGSMKTAVHSMLIRLLPLTPNKVHYR